MTSQQITIGDCNACGASDVPVRWLKLPSDAEDTIAPLGRNYCAACWELIKPDWLEEIGEPLANFDQA